MKKLDVNSMCDACPLKEDSCKVTKVPTSPINARVAVREHGYKGIEVGEALSLSPSTVSRIVECGEISLIK